MTTDERISLIRLRLTQAFTPDMLEVIDESHKHIGHAGSENGAGHFAIQITATAFAEKKLVDCHRQIYALLGDLLGTEIHALKIQIKSSKS